LSSDESDDGDDNDNVKTVPPQNEDSSSKPEESKELNLSPTKGKNLNVKFKDISSIDEDAGKFISDKKLTEGKINLSSMDND
jgi:hypothetical protein